MQLPPVMENASHALLDSFFSDRNIRVKSYDLTEVIRQASGSAILNNAMLIRDLASKEKRTQLQLLRREGEMEDMASENVVQSYCSKEPLKAAIVCYSNRLVNVYNKRVRTQLFPDKSTVQVGDRLIVVRNNCQDGYPLMNGEFLTVKKVNAEIEPRRLMVGNKEVELVFRKLVVVDNSNIELEKLIIDSLLQSEEGSLSNDELKALFIDAKVRIQRRYRNENVNSKEFAIALNCDPYYNALHVKYGYAITCHKSQGGEWNTVYVDFWGRLGLDRDSLRWKYTAITRASEQLYCINLHDVTLVSELTVHPIARTKNIPEEARCYAECDETPYHDLTSPIYLRAKYWAIARNLKGTCYVIKRVWCLPYLERYTINGPKGDADVDFGYNKGGVFKSAFMQRQDEELCRLMDDESTIEYSYSYDPESEPLVELHAKVESICSALGISIMNVRLGAYSVIYSLRTKARYAALEFNYNSKGIFTSVRPMSELGEEDAQLAQLVEQLQE